MNPGSGFFEKQRDTSQANNEKKREEANRYNKKMIKGRSLLIPQKYKLPSENTTEKTPLHK